MVKAIKDGDTIVADIQLPWDVTLRDKTIRCAGYDAWESSKRRQTVKVTDEEVRKGKIATKALQDLFKDADKVVIIKAETKGHNYGRLAGYIFVVKNKKYISVAKFMIDNGHIRDP